MNRLCRTGCDVDFLSMLKESVLFFSHFIVIFSLSLDESRSTRMPVAAGSLLVNKKQDSLGSEPVRESQKHRRTRTTQPDPSPVLSTCTLGSGCEEAPFPWICTKGSESQPERAGRASLFPVPYERKEQFYHVASFKDYSPENQNSSVIGTLALMFIAWSHNSFLSKWGFFSLPNCWNHKFREFGKEMFSH